MRSCSSGGEFFFSSSGRLERTSRDCLLIRFSKISFKPSIDHRFPHLLLGKKKKKSFLICPHPPHHSSPAITNEEMDDDAEALISRSGREICA